ncbi:MAG TPA: hypothetical protein VIN66_01315 [Rheinheimera sp.]|uniref:hypothetical protein n=1 Tax=Rheinheimera sp. TaxID=1869214 RepID=UPI002F95B42D
MKSSKNNRLKALEQAIKDAHDYALEHCDLPLNNMPEYFLGVAIGKHMVKEFENFNVRFEMSVQQLLEYAEIEVSGDIANRENGRFDLVLMTKRYQKPAHVVEIKKGIKVESMFADILRLANLCRFSNLGSRLETNYFVTITAKSEKVIDERVAQLQAMMNENSSLTSVSISSPKKVLLDSSEDKQIIAAIYEVTYQHD